MAPGRLRADDVCDSSIRRPWRPTSQHCPCFTHPLYNRYLESFLTELLETYPIDGIVMIRDDNGGLCPCQRCKEYVERSATKSAAWEQYLILYRWLRDREFRGDIAVYPYWDYYEPRLDPVLPADLLVVGHGSGATVLARDYERSAPMGDTWLDNVFASFRVASTARMRRLLADRNAFWIGGALRGSELPWQSIGRFGWEPTATVNSFRFEWACRAVWPRARALRSGPDRHLRETLGDLRSAAAASRVDEAQRRTAYKHGRTGALNCSANSAATRGSRAELSESSHETWLRHVELFGVYFKYHAAAARVVRGMHERGREQRSRQLNKVDSWPSHSVKNCWPPIARSTRSPSNTMGRPRAFPETCWLARVPWD